MKTPLKSHKLWRILTVAGKYLDDVLVVLGIGFLAAAGFMIHMALGLAILGIGCVGYAIFVSLGR